METYIDRHMPRGALVAVLVIALLAVALPSVGMLWAPTDSTTENRRLAEAPTLFEEDGSVNLNVLSDAGAYFDDHFAYRNVLVAANARIRSVLGTSSTDQVVQGTGGWLYYGGTLPDYLGQNKLSDRALRNIAHNLALAQAYVESRGAAFAFTIAPNKNSLYPGHMPYYYLESPDAGNAERLAPLLEEAGVSYVDLFSVFEGGTGEGEQRYLKQDSHWDNRGALMATQRLLAALGSDPVDLSAADAIARDDFTGDLESMLYPVGAQTEVNWYFEGYDDGAGMSGARWAYDEGSDVTDSWIRTRSLAGSGSLLMFRDSFGNALAPLWASVFKSAAFSKLLPYNLPAMEQVNADAVVIERAERHLEYLATNPPIMPAPRVELDVGPIDAGELPDGGATVSAGVDGPYWKVEGSLPGHDLPDDAHIYVSVEVPDAAEVVYDASWVTSPAGGSASPATDFGYLLYLDRDVVDLSDATVRVYAVENGSPVCSSAFDDIA